MFQITMDVEKEQRGAHEQWIKEGEDGVRWTGLPCHDFIGDEIKLLLFVLPQSESNESACGTSELKSNVVFKGLKTPKHQPLWEIPA